MKGARLLNFRVSADPRGALVALEGMKDLPFEMRRVFYMYGMKGDTVRGKHANSESVLLFVAVCGLCRITVDDGSDRQEFLLDSPEIGLLCEPLTWKEMHGFSPDCVLMGISDRPYNSREYINDHDKFMNVVTSKAEGKNGA